MAQSTKVDKTFYQVTDIKLRQTSMLRLFDILLAPDRTTKYLNIFKSLRVNTSQQSDYTFFSTYETSNNTFWDTIANEIYGTPYLWWVVALFNDVFNPFEDLNDGQNLQILKPDYVFTLFKDIDAIREL